MFADTSLWLMLGSMASAAGLLGFWFERESEEPGSMAWSPSQFEGED